MGKWWRLLFVLLILLGSGRPGSPVVYAQGDTVAQVLLDQMSVAERVGQLFLVTFEGDVARPDSPITRLITEYHIGGVVLLAENDNLTSVTNGPQQAADLTNQLQNLALLGASALITATVGDDSVPPTETPVPAGANLPLFIAMPQNGGGAPHDELWHGLTTVPDQLAIGATWQPDYARDIGQIVGSELMAIGVNMLLGPSLDVLEDPVNPNNLNTSVFGGDPYWVGVMGGAYTSGVQAGGAGRLAVIAKHFPGFGNSDRPLGEDVATVPRSLEQLQAVELAPFIAVTDPANPAGAVVDGLLTTHIRYQGFQEDTQAATAPITFDPLALQTLLALPGLAEWRQAGGLVVSDALGGEAVQRTYDDTGVEFPHRRIAKDALFAGNDVLYLTDFALNPANGTEQLLNITDTISWFQERYVTDASFQQQIDEAVLRILQLKLRLYDGDFSVNNVVVANPAGLSDHTATLFTIAEDTITLITNSNNAAQLLTPPDSDDRIVIFTDVRPAQQCGSCPSETLLDADSLEQNILALYGPEGSDQIQFNRLRSFTFDELYNFLTFQPEPTPTPSPSPDPGEEPTVTPIPPTATPSVPEQIEGAMNSADWLIFAMQDVDPAIPASSALNLLLAERPDLLRDRRVVVFAYNTPNFLDTTEVSQVDAFFAVYSRIASFVDASVRALFLESPLGGAPPIDVPSVGYDLAEMTRPDTQQVLELYINQNDTLVAPLEDAPLDVDVGDTLSLRTGVIFDFNGNPVPDGTMVQFIQRDRLEDTIRFVAERTTVNGVAGLEYVLPSQTGQFRITVATDGAVQSQELDIFIEEAARIIVVTPTPLPTLMPTSVPSVTPTFRPTGTPTSTPTPMPTPAPVPTEPGLTISLTELSAVLGLLLGLLGVVGLGIVSGRVWGLALAVHFRLVLWGTLGGLLVYVYFAAGLPGTAWLTSFGTLAGFLTTFVGGVVGLGMNLLMGTVIREG